MKGQGKNDNKERAWGNISNKDKNHGQLQLVIRMKKREKRTQRGKNSPKNVFD